MNQITTNRLTQSKCGSLGSGTFTQLVIQHFSPSQVFVSLHTSVCGDKSSSRLTGIKTRSPPESPPWSLQALSLHHYWTGSSWWESQGLLCHTPLAPDLSPLPVQAPHHLRVWPPEAGVGALWRCHPHRRSRFVGGGALVCTSTGAWGAHPENNFWPGSGWWTGKAASAFSVQLGPKFQNEEKCVQLYYYMCNYILWDYIQDILATLIYHLFGTEQVA